MSKVDTVREACRLGAKLHRHEDTGRWIVLDMPGTPLWNLTFSSIKNAASAFIIVHEKARKSAPALIAFAS